MDASKLFSLNVRDLTKGVVVAVIAVVLGAFQQAFSTNGLDFAAFDWASILNVAVTTAVAYLAKNFITSPDGKVGGVL